MGKQSGHVKVVWPNHLAAQAKGIYVCRIERSGRLIFGEGNRQLSFLGAACADRRVDTALTVRHSLLSRIYDMILLHLMVATVQSCDGCHIHIIAFDGCHDSVVSYVRCCK